MEEEEDKDDKKDKVERQHKAAEENKHGGVSASRVQAETSRNIENKGAQDQGSEVFQMSSEIKVLEAQAQNENGMNSIKESTTQKNDSASNAGESSLNTIGNQDPLSVTEGAVLEDKPSINAVVETLEGVQMNNKVLSSDEDSQNFKTNSTEPIYQNFPLQLQQPQDSEESLLLSENLGSHIPESFARETTEHREKDKKGVTKPDLKHCGSPKKQLKQATSGDIREKQTHPSESKRDDLQSESQRQKQLSKGQKSVQALKQIGKESQQKEGKEKARKQDLQSTSETDKTQQRKGETEQRKTQSDQKLKTEEKQMLKAKDGKKQPLFQKEQRLMSKPAEIRKTDKKEQKLSAGQKELQSLPSKKPSVHRKEPLPSPKKNSPSQALTKQKQSNLLKKVQQKAVNPNIIKNNESKGISQQKPAEDGLLVTKIRQNPSLPESTMAPPSMELQETSGKSMPKENNKPLPKSEKESGKDLLKENKKQEEVQTQGTNKLTEKKSQQEKKNEIKKQKQQNEVNQQLKQLKKENLQSHEHVNKTPQKSGQNIKATMPQKKEESPPPLVARKQASKANKDLKDVDISAQRNRETNAMQQQMDKKSAKQQSLKEGREIEKPNRNIQTATVSKNSAKENSSQDVIHSIRRQYKQLCKEEAMKQQLPHSHQPAQKEEKAQQQKPEVKCDENKVGRKENLNQLAKKKSEDYEDDKGLGCAGMQASSCPIYFGVRSYLHHFYDTTPVKNPQLYEEYTVEDDFEYAVDPVKPRGCRKCCQGFWFRAGLWGGINLILVGVITFLVGYLTPQREIIVGQQGDLEILDRSAIIFNHRLELCRLAGLAVFCCGGMVLFVVLFISTLLHVRGHTNEGTCCAESIYYHGYAATPMVEPFIVAQDLSVPSTTGIKIPIIEEIKSVQPTIWPEMGTVRDGSRVGQMP